VRHFCYRVECHHGQSAEVKLVMRKDAIVRYNWSTIGGPVNFDTHGDPSDAPDAYHGYGKGKNQTGDTGTLQAAFNGNHGWFWRNRSNAEVSIQIFSATRLSSPCHTFRYSPHDE
jgi:hypothetical protein